MRPYSPGGVLNALATTPRGSIPRMPSTHRLRRGLPGYLIPFAPHAFVPQCQKWSSSLPSPLVFLPISTDITPTLGIPATSTILKLVSFSARSKVEPWAFNRNLASHLRYSLRPVTPDNAWIPRMTAAAGTELANPYSYGTVIIFPYKSSLRPEGLHPARGVAPSGLRPLWKIPYCCLP